MGKAAKLKKIRKLASQMPLLMVNHVKGERVTGEELSKEGVTEVQGKPVRDKDFYTKKTAVQQPLNHNRRMKKMYNKFGARGVQGYMQAVNNHMKKFEAKNAV